MHAVSIKCLNVALFRLNHIIEPSDRCGKKEESDFIGLWTVQTTKEPSGFNLDKKKKKIGFCLNAALVC